MVVFTLVGFFSNRKFEPSLQIEYLNLESTVLHTGLESIMSLNKKLVTFQDAKKILGSVYPDLAFRTQSKLKSLRSGLLNKNLGNEDPKAQYRINWLFEDESRGKSRSLSSVRTAVKRLPEKVIKKKLSNVLIFPSKNQLLDISDFQKMVPLSGTKFNLKWTPTGYYQFLVRAMRNPHKLDNVIGYYLIFKSVDEAAGYVIDTLGKQLNGVNFYLKMVDPQEEADKINLSLLYEKSEMDGDVMVPVTAFPRDRSVLVKGIPLFVTESTMEKMLYDYSLDFNTKAIEMLENDPHAKLGSWLLKFKDPVDAQRFVRNFNGFSFNRDPKFPKVIATVLS